MASIEYEAIAQYQYEQARTKRTHANEIDPDEIYHAFAMMYGGNGHPRIPARVVVEDVQAEVGQLSGPGLSELQALFTTVDDSGIFMLSADINSFGLWKPRSESGLYFLKEQRVEPPLHGLDGTVQHMVARAVQGFLLSDDEYAKLRLGKHKKKPTSLKPYRAPKIHDVTTVQPGAGASLSPSRR